MKYIVIFFLLCIPTIGHAQQTTISSGGDAAGIGGKVTYSVGQVAWNILTGTNGSVIQGVQQPYEISVISGIDYYEVSLNYVAYPNPTSDAITLKIGNTDLIGLKYQLYSVVGVLLQEKVIEAGETEIRLESYPASTYLLRIVKDNLMIKLFKIVKK